LNDPRYLVIYRMIRAIPAGRVTTYGEVAATAGLPHRARLVGRALRGCPRDVPWHRVVAAPGRIAFAAGSDGFQEQCRRLQEEGVACPDGRIDLQRFGWRTDLDALLWGPSGG
jgi:methylated-DNA-protein-cysteine methyltransferase-like protein